jgi:CRISPR-associated protein (TIGR02584 family)
MNSTTSSNILVAIAGGSPAIVTETLWALTQQRGERVDEVRVITTAKGEGLIQSALLDPQANESNPNMSRFVECCRECGLTPDGIKFEIHTLHQQEGVALTDIRDDAENQLAADQICRLIQQWTQEANTRLFGSAAGGRKTMSIYLTIAMMLYGRKDDRLFHVLVHPEDFEFCKEFFHPYRTPRELPVKDRKGKIVSYLNTRDVSIDLAEVPLVKLSVLDTSKLSPETSTYSEIVNAVQQRLEWISRAASSQLTIERSQIFNGRVPVQVGGKTCYLPKAQGFIYTLIAENRKMNGGGEGLEVELISPRDLKRIYRRLTGNDYSDFLEGTEFDFLFKWMQQLNSKSIKGFRQSVIVNVSRANDAFEAIDFPRQFWIHNLNESKPRGKNSLGASYTINLPGDAIHLPSL